MQLNNEVVNLHDRVFDISVQRGFGHVIKISTDYFEVRFNNNSVRYDTEGKQIGKPWPTLFWTMPVVVPPVKDDQTAHAKRELVEKVFDLVREYKDYV